MSGQTLPRQNFHQEAEASINRQINFELHAYYSYLSMWAHFDRDDIALPGFSKFFKKKADEELEDARKLMEYQNRRGGRVVLQAIEKPETDDWGSGLRAMEKSLQLQKNMNDAYLDLHGVSEKHNDAETSHYVKQEFLDKHTTLIKQLADHVAVLKRVGPGLGEYLFDKESL